MNDRFFELIRRANISRAWIGLVTTTEEIQTAQRNMQEAQSQISLMDKLNVFTDSPEEARVKDCQERIAVRSQERDTYKKDVARFLNSLEPQIEHFSFAVRLERALVQAGELSSLQTVESLSKDLTQWLLEVTPFSEEQLERDIDSVFSWSVDSFVRTIPALWALRATLSMVNLGAETRFGQSQPILLYRPVINELVERCHEAFRQDCPQTPLPSDLFALIRTSAPETVSQSRQQEAMKSALDQALQTRLPRLVEISSALGAVQFLLERNKGSISTFDRVVFWSDTKAEAREKAFKEKAKSLRTQFEHEWRELTIDNLALRENVWGAFLLDHAAAIPYLVSKVSATSPSGFISKTSEVAYREEPTLAIEDLRRTIVSRFPLGIEMEALKRRALAYSQQEAREPYQAFEPDPLPQVLEVEELVKRLARELSLTDYAQESSSAQTFQESAYRLFSERKERIREAGLMEQLGMVAGTLTALRDTYLGYRQANALGGSAEHSLFRALGRAHSPTAVGHLLSELGVDLAAVTAEVRDRQVRKSDGNTRTEYYSVLIGMEPVRRKCDILQQMIFEQAEGLGYPIESLESHSVGPAARLLQAQPLRY